MTRVELEATAIEDLDAMIVTHNLPANTHQRVKRPLRSPELAPSARLSGPWSGFRFILGPWRWMILVYVVVQDEDRAVVLAVQDARSSSATIHLRR